MFTRPPQGWSRRKRRIVRVSPNRLPPTLLRKPAYEFLSGAERKQTITGREVRADDLEDRGSSCRTDLVRRAGSVLLVRGGRGRCDETTARTPDKPAMVSETSSDLELPRAGWARSGADVSGATSRRPRRRSQDR